MDVTRYMDLSLKPIPHEYPIPPNSVACLRGEYFFEELESGTFFLICKNKQELLITGPPLKRPPGMEDLSEYDAIQLLDKVFADYFTIIEDLIPTIEFGITQYAQLIPDPYTGGYQIVLDYEKRLRRVSCPTWAPLISLEEIEFTVLGPVSDRRGLWNGKEVDIFYAYDDFNMWRLNRSMYGLRRVDGLDFTFELYGHLVDRDGMIIGLVSEAAHGRPIRPSDKAFVTSELKRLESVGCLYTAVWCNHLMISNGKLRLLQWVAIRPYKNQDQLKKDAAFYHTEFLDTLCQEMEDFGPFGHYRFLPVILTKSTDTIHYLRHSIPRFDLPVQTMVFVKNVNRPGFRAVINYADNDQENDQNNLPMTITSLKMRNPQRNSRQMFHSNRRQFNVVACQDEDDPLSSNVRLRHRVFLSMNYADGRGTSIRTLRSLPSYRSFPETDADTGAT